MSIATQVKRLQDVRNQIRAKMVSLGLSTNTDLLQDLANDLDGVAFRGDASTTLSTSTRSKTLDAGYYTGGTIKVPSDYFPVNSTNTTATAGDVLSGKKFVNTSGATVTGSIATATANDVSGSVSGGDPKKITLTAASTTGSSSTTATAKAIVTKGLYTGSSNIEKSLTSKTITATAEATLATSVSGSTTVPSTLPAGTVTITPNTDNTKRIYSDSTNKGFITNIVLNAMDTSSVSSATTTDPGTDYANKVTVTPSTSAQYVKITKGYLPNSKITINKMASGSVSSASTTNPGDSYTNQTTVTPSTSAQYVKVTAGYLPNSKITVKAIPNQKGKDDVTATVTADVSNITSINASQVTDGVTVTASASGSTVVPVGYYSTQVSKTPRDSKSTTIKPKLAGTNGAIELTAGTSAFTKTSTADYSNGFITRIKVNPTPSETKEFTPTIKGGTVDPTPGSLLSSVTVKGVPYFSFNIPPDSWKSDSNVTAGKYYYNAYNINITASNNLYVMPSNTSKAQSFGVYAYSQSRSGAMGLLQFRAMAQPTSDLTYTVYYLN